MCSIAGGRGNKRRILPEIEHKVSVHVFPVGPDAHLARRLLPLAHTPHEQTALERQIEAADRQIDALVYELYGLTE